MLIRARRALALVVALVSLSAIAPIAQRAPATTLPKQLSDKAFWQLVEDFSEPDGTFRSENVVSNETTFQEIIPDLQKRASPDGVYMGVGPDQNFTYIATLRPRMAFIVDIRRQNLVEHLLYKALIEMSSDRAEFLSRLFSRPKPGGLASTAEPEALFEAYGKVEPTEALFKSNLEKVEDWLIERHKFKLTFRDRQDLEFVYSAFYQEGPGLNYSFPRTTAASRWFPTYRQLMTASDLTGRKQSYLANEQNFRALRDFQKKNLLVPIVGDFAGERAIRSVSRYLVEHAATVNFFYTSNVEQYLFQGDTWQRYSDNLATLPLNDNSMFIRAYFDAGYFYPPGIITPDLHSTQLMDPILGVLAATREGLIRSYLDLVFRRRSNGATPAPVPIP